MQNVTCDACHSVGEPFIGHTVQYCPNISPKDRAEVVRSFATNMDTPEEDEGINPECTDFSNMDNRTAILEDSAHQVTTSRINIEPSPQFNVKIGKTIVTMVMDTGATGSMISMDLCKVIGLQIFPSAHSATQADGDTSLKVIGEVHTSVLMNENLSLPLDAVVVEKLKAGLLVGMAFMRANKVVINVPEQFITVKDAVINFSNRIGNPKVSLLRMEANNVIFPGEEVVLPTPKTFDLDKDVAIEPRDETDVWFSPRIIGNGDILTLTNELDIPIKLRKGQIVGQMRSVAMPEQHYSTQTEKSKSSHLKSMDVDFTKDITISSSLMNTEITNFQDLHRKYKVQIVQP